MTHIEAPLFPAEMTTLQALALFDNSEPVNIDFMLGRWRGTGLPTQHPLDGLLENYNWYGKEFIDAENVDPLLFANRQGHLFKVNPSFMPTILATRFPFLKSVLANRLFTLVSPLLTTTEHKARLRMTEYRGKYSATMIYDALPINDVFRKIDQNTLIGAMDLKGIEQPFFFMLHRDQ